MKTSKLFTTTLILSTAILFVVSCSSKNEEQTFNKTKKTVTKLVRIYTVHEKTMKKTLELTGTIEAENTANILSTADGKISKLFFREGDKVKENQIAAIISPNLREDIVNSARLNFQRAKIKSDKNPTDAKLKAELRKAKENLEFARKQYKEIPIVAPLSGIISQRYVDLGDMINAKTKIYEIQSNKGFRIKIPISELDIKKVKVGQHAELHVDACPDKIFSSTITRIYPTIDTKTRNGIIELKFNNPDINIHAGMFARAVFTTQVLKNVVSIPTSAIIERPNKKTCFVIEKNTAKEKDIMTGFEANNYTEILSGLSVGEKIVLEGQSSLKNGTKVKVLKKGKEK